jgi:hypothetical protein
MAKRKEGDETDGTPKTSVPAGLVLQVGERLTVHAALGDRLTAYVIEAREGGLLRMYPAPEPAPPVQTPEPAAGGNQTKKFEA